MKTGQYMKYFEAHDIPTYTSTGEKGDITTSGENNFVMIMGGMRDQLLTFIEEHAGGKFIVIFKEVGEEQWYILGNYDRPMVLSSYESKNDKDGRYVTFTFKRTSIDQYYKYAGVLSVFLQPSMRLLSNLGDISSEQPVRNPERIRSDLCHQCDIRPHSQ